MTLENSCQVSIPSMNQVEKNLSYLWDLEAIFKVSIPSMNQVEKNFRDREGKYGKDMDIGVSIPSMNQVEKNFGAFGPKLREKYSVSIPSMNQVEKNSADEAWALYAQAQGLNPFDESGREELRLPQLPYDAGLIQHATRTYTV